MARLENRVAIVTGAGQGVGRGVAVAMAKEGAAIVAAVRNPETGPQVLQQLQGLGAKALLVPCDVTQRSQIDAAVKAAVSAFGTVDILVNCAHDTSGLHAPFMDFTEEMLHKQWYSGFMGSVWFMQACFPHLKGRGGRIINFASGAGVRGELNLLGYAASKEAIRAATRVAAREWAQFGITSNCICPLADSPAMDQYTAHPEWGWDRILPVLPIQRLGSCEHEIGRTAVFLASADASFITGHTIHVDGGYMMDAGR